MNIEQSFQYIETNNLTSNFTDSLKESYGKWGRLTPKQQKCLSEVVENHKSIIKIFKSLKNEIQSNDFLTSLHEQFNERGWLSKKQIIALRKFCKFL